MGTYILFKHIFAPFSIAPWPLVVVIFFFSVVVHEVSHGLMAYKCGDSTAKDMGRITLNPIPHIDIFGTIIVPVLLYFMGGFIIGWAKPVPINPNNFNNIKKCTIKVGFSGVLANFALAVLFSLIIWGMNFLRLYQTDSGLIIMAVLAAGVAVNIVLGLFNLIPIPPLDGSRVVSSLLPDNLAVKYDSIAAFGFFILILTLRFWWALIIPFGNMFYKLLFWGLPL
jgi:Zn-dependent protease